MVYMLLGTGFEETEAIAPLDLLRRAGVEVLTVGLSGKTIYGSHHIGIEADITVEQMIEVMMGYLHNLEETLMTFDDKRVNTSNVNNLMFTAYSRFPSLHRKAQRLSLKEVELWRKALYNSQKAGTIRRDFDRDQVALMFSHIKNTYDNGLGRTQMDFSLLEKSYREFHKIIKSY